MELKIAMLFGALGVPHFIKELMIGFSMLIAKELAITPAIVCYYISYQNEAIVYTRSFAFVSRWQIKKFSIVLRAMASTHYMNQNAFGSLVIWQTGNKKWVCLLKFSHQTHQCLQLNRYNYGVNITRIFVMMIRIFVMMIRKKSCRRIVI